MATKKLIIISLCAIAILIAAATLLRISATNLAPQSESDQQTSQAENVAEQPVEVKDPNECNIICEQSCAGFINDNDTSQCLDECFIICTETAATVE